MKEADCDHCEYYDKEDGVCTAFVCDGLDCDQPLPCEEDDKK